MVQWFCVATILHWRRIWSPAYKQVVVTCTPKGVGDKYMMTTMFTLHGYMAYLLLGVKYKL